MMEQQTDDQVTVPMVMQAKKRFPELNACSFEFKRYVALAVVARNIHRIGALLWKQEQERATEDARFESRAPAPARGIENAPTLLLTKLILKIKRGERSPRVQPKNSSRVVRFGPMRY